MVKRGRGRPPAKTTKKSNINGESAPEFFKVFLPRLASHQLLIPPDFIRYFKRTIKERVVLKDAGGKKWYIDVEQTPKGFYFKKGWQSFVEYHRLTLGEFLVFKYDKCYSFVVKIYGTNACKKEITTPDLVTHVKIEPETERVVEDPLLMSNDKAECSGEKCDELKEAGNDLPRGFRVKLTQHGVTGDAYQDAAVTVEAGSSSEAPDDIGDLSQALAKMGE
ncbi:putative B3 domain-containing protein at5g66980 [Phtheirospermum japonicum]|uniref:Putative B3 domain-containing protein at5g66980 n=1 Tax=Phtheirospermum japonicum TaxID=374723 RepID=A0A830CHS8_9LAMI|nr:putative B3 domain-containing protein at5g66980 [Phtheirospermum japonicum]